MKALKHLYYGYYSSFHVLVNPGEQLKEKERILKDNLFLCQASVIYLKIILLYLKWNPLFKPDMLTHAESSFF